MIAQENKQIKKMIEDKISHPYLKQHINQPFIDENRINSLLSILNEVDMPTEKKHDKIIAIMLVQIALDTHDLVKNKMKTSKDELDRKLFVLAGDFYSGLYYKTLADIDELSLVNVLADGIKSINEEKILLYEYEVKDWNDFLDTLSKIESKLIVNVGELYDRPEYIKVLSKEWLMLNRMIKEGLAIKENKYSFVQSYIKETNMFLHNESIINKIEKDISYRKEKIKSIIEEYDMSYKEIFLIENDIKILTAVEEG